MFKIRNLMCNKVVTAKEDMSVLDACRLLNQRHVGSVVVVDDEQKCTGIFTERDLIRIVSQETPLDQPLGKVMTKNVVTISIDASFEEARRLMAIHQIRHLPVTDQTGKVMGIFSMRAFFDEIHGVKTAIPSST